MQLMFDCIGSIFDAQETEVIYDAIMRFQPPQGYDARKRLILDDLRDKLKKAADEK